MRSLRMATSDSHAIKYPASGNFVNYFLGVVRRGNLFGHLNRCGVRFFENFTDICDKPQALIRLVRSNNMIPSIILTEENRLAPDVKPENLFESWSFLTAA